MDQVAEALLTGAGMLWKALWALIFGYTISACIQVLVTREQMARILGERGAKPAALAGFFGFISSSCSFAALAASRSVLVKGAHPANALAFLISSTNLVLELGIVLWVLLGWRFTLGNIPAPPRFRSIDGSSPAATGTRWCIIIITNSSSGAGRASGWCRGPWRRRGARPADQGNRARISSPPAS